MKLSMILAAGALAALAIPAAAAPRTALDPTAANPYYDCLIEQTIAAWNATRDFNRTAYHATAACFPILKHGYADRVARDMQEQAPYLIATTIEHQH